MKQIVRLTGDLRRAAILLEADADGPAWDDATIAEAVGCRTRTIENVRQAFVLEGFEAAPGRLRGRCRRDLRGNFPGARVDGARGAIALKAGGAARRRRERRQASRRPGEGAMGGRFRRRGGPAMGTLLGLLGIAIPAAGTAFAAQPEGAAAEVDAPVRVPETVIEGGRTRPTEVEPAPSPIGPCCGRPRCSN